MLLSTALISVFIGVALIGGTIYYMKDGIGGFYVKTPSFLGGIMFTERQENSSEPTNISLAILLQNSFSNLTVPITGIDHGDDFYYIGINNEEPQCHLDVRWNLCVRGNLTVDGEITGANCNCSDPGPQGPPGSPGVNGTCTDQQCNTTDLCPLSLCELLQNTTFNNTIFYGSFVMDLPNATETFSTIVIETSMVWHELNSSNINRSLAEFGEGVDTFDTGYNILQDGVYSIHWLAGVDCETGQSCALRAGVTLNHTMILRQSEVMFDTVDSDQIGQVMLLDFINLSVGDVISFSIANWQNTKDIFIHAIYSTIQWISPPRTPINSQRKRNFPTK